ncbi:NAD(P)-binding protein [Aspergillus campestris IBT 28561]|uniref:NAD(P)-binding protein n=1 Tax=Aspergillus campestris (strain IBT 28561) TaxID=1392248 RepID=A0A2I1D1E5_ASPC2|nr:NAD(P)-binding protein [Aspergillus campestris IBT 28561]PKY03699.1 NAD(P)-binding protein [Aspergillus campestris IBT 28561]
MTRIFLTGASGYIGGDILHLIKSTHPEYACSTLVRDSAKAAAISKEYPNVRVVLGDLDSAALLEQEASQADVVIHAASSNHIKSVEAIARGKPAYWIQVSGASILSISDIVNGTYGEGTDKTFSDLDGADEVREIIHQNSATRAVDDFILNLTSPKTALVFPPIIYGQGRGPTKQRSVQIPELARVAAQTRASVRVGRGEATWSNVHISDISGMFLKLVERAAACDGDGDLWNKNGLYFPGIDAMNFKDLAQIIADEAYKLALTDSATVKEISHEEADALSGHAGILWGTNAVQNSQRARLLLGWTPSGRSLQEEIPVTLRLEAIRLGLL